MQYDHDFIEDIANVVEVSQFSGVAQRGAMSMLTSDYRGYRHGTRDQR